MQQKNTQVHWYLLYTKPRAEKKVALELQQMGYEVFLPLQKVLRQWSDRKKWVEEPLFNSYLFILIDYNNSYQFILNTPGIVSFVKFNNLPAKIYEREIDFLRDSLDCGKKSDYLQLYNDSNKLEIGSEVEILFGALKGYKAKLVSFHGHQKILIELLSIKRQVLISMPNGIVKSKSTEMLVSN
jgi:transcriptional antiterminator RfaH